MLVVRILYFRKYKKDVNINCINKYMQVRRRTGFDNLQYSSHVMKYGNASRGNDLVSSYIGTNPANDNYTFLHDSSSPPTPARLVSQRDADLLHFWQKVFSFYLFIYSISAEFLFCFILLFS
jgi:hypothetical protein